MHQRSIEAVFKRANTEFYRRSFSFRGVQDWNNLSEEVRTLSSLESFKSRLKFITLVIITYSNCKVCMLSTTVDFYCKFMYVDL